MHKEKQHYLPSVYYFSVDNYDQHIQVRFLKPLEISGVVTQGHAVLPVWVSKYRVSYSPDGLEPFIYYSDSPSENPKVIMFII